MDYAWFWYASVDRNSFGARCDCNGWVVAVARHIHCIWFSFTKYRCIYASEVGSIFIEAVVGTCGFEYSAGQSRFSNIRLLKVCFSLVCCQKPSHWHAFHPLFIHRNLLFELSLRQSRFDGVDPYVRHAGNQCVFFYDVADGIPEILDLF